MKKYNLQQHNPQDANASFNKTASIYASVDQYGYQKLHTK
jgi:hypothetical protein